MNQNVQPTPTEPIAELQLIVTDTNSLAVQDAERAALVATLQPIALSIAHAKHYAESLKVESKEDADLAASQRDIFTANAEKAETAINDYGDGMIGRIFALHRRWTGSRNSIVDPLKGAAKTVKQKIIQYQEAEAEKARKETARLQAIEDERARKEAERLTKAAEKIKSPERKLERLEAAAAVVPTVVRVAPPVASVKSQKRWRVASIDRKAFFSAAANDPNLQGFVTINEAALAANKSRNTMMSVPGVAFEQYSV